MSEIPVTESDESPTLEEVYDASPLINNNNNKYIYLTDSDDSDLPDFKFIDTNKLSKQPCCSTSAEDLIRSLIPAEHMDDVAKDYYTTKDVNNSINRYFDGSIVSSSFSESACKLETDSIPTASMHHHDNMEICSESDDEVNSFSLQFSPLCDSDECVYDTKPIQTSTPIITTTIPPTASTTTTTTNRKRQHEATKRKETKTLTILKYTITTTTNLNDKHLLAHFKNGIKVSQNNDLTFEQTPSSPSEVQSVQWRCEEHIVTPQGTTKHPLDCDYTCLVYSMVRFSEEFQRNREFVEEAVSRCETKCVLLVYGVDEFFSHLEPGDISRDTFDSFEAYLNIKLHLTVHLANTILQASDILVRVMRGVKGIVHKKERKFQFTVTPLRKGRSVKTREDQTKVLEEPTVTVTARVRENSLRHHGEVPTPALLK